jgi:predicted Zn-dependent peptidase
VAEEFFIKELPNGMTLLGQRMPHVSSAAMSLVVPAGASRDAAGSEGAAAVASEWCLRGAGDRDTRALNDALDALGCRHDEAARSEHIQFSAAQLGRNLPGVLALYADIIRRPRLEEASFRPSRELIIQDLASLEDEPAHKCNVLLRERFYPHPLGRCVYGREASLRAMTDQTARRHVQTHFTPAGAILAVAGNIDWDAFSALAEEQFGEWSAEAAGPIEPGDAAGGTTHVKKDSAQTHIALAHRSVPISHGQYYAARMAVAVLSAGMGSRLFTEVREKRGLVYHVSCRYDSVKGHAGLFTYAGTRPAVAQETFDVTARELCRLAEGVGDDELARARTQLKSALVMQGQATTARAAALVSDWHHLRRLRSLDEIAAAIDAVTGEEVLAYVRAFPAEGFTVLVIGPEPVETEAKP